MLVRFVDNLHYNEKKSSHFGFSITLMGIFENIANIQKSFNVNYTSNVVSGIFCTRCNIFKLSLFLF